MPVVVKKIQVNKKKSDSKAAHWSDRQKFEAVTTYMMTGSWPVVSEATSIPIDTLRHWKMQPWWKELESQIRQQRHVEISGKLKRVIDKAFEVIEDRVENGDWHYNPRTQKVERRPVNARVAGEILTKAIDKEILLEKLAEKPVQAEEAVMDRLKAIEMRLLEAAKVKRDPPQVIEGELVEVKND